MSGIRLVGENRTTALGPLQYFHNGIGYLKTQQIITLFMMQASSYVSFKLRNIFFQLS